MHVFLSPHFDDAVYSCGGTIHHLGQQNERVHVVTVMAGDVPQPPPDSPIVRDLHARWEAGSNPIATRQREDKDALAQLGAHPAYLPIPDCVYRTHAGQALYPDEASLWGAIHPHDNATAMLHTLSTFEALGIYERVSTLYVPLGVGEHVDHRIVRAWGIQLAQAHPSTRLRFYTDYPYLREEARIAQALQSVAWTLESVWQALTLDNMACKVSAITAYRSQLSTFWQDDTHARDEVFALFRNPDGLFAERYWQIKG